MDSSPAAATAAALPLGAPPAGARSEAVLVLLYFALHLASLFLTLEGELTHWITLVLLPSALLLVARARVGGDVSAVGLLRSVGLRAGNLRAGIVWAVPLGLGLSLLQLGVSRNRGEILSVLGSPRAVYLLPAAFALLLLTAAFTEEYFFRGILQERLARWWGSDAGAVIVASLLFGLYHVPYAYLRPTWPSHGDPWAALTSSLVQGGVGGLILGVTYVRARGNLLAPVLVHASINLLPAARWLGSVWT
jgi:membrane protease YdiL (CAAX protease family)